MDNVVTCFVYPVSCVLCRVTSVGCLPPALTVNIGFIHRNLLGFPWKSLIFDGFHLKAGQKEGLRLNTPAAFASLGGFHKQF